LNHRIEFRDKAGVTDQDIAKPFIGIANSYTSIVQGHVHLRELGEAVKEDILEAGGTPFEFNTTAVCYGIAMGHQGMQNPFEYVGDFRIAESFLQSQPFVGDSFQQIVVRHVTFIYK